MSARTGLPRARARARTRLAAAAAAAAMALAVSLAAPTPVVAHELAVTTARVTLRDDHIDVHIELDALALVARVAAVDPPALMAIDEAELAAFVARAKVELETGAHLDADGARIGLEVRAFPASTVLRALAANQAASPHDHGQLSPVELEATRPAAGARRITLSLPPALGEALISFVQPAARWTQPGAAAGFSVLEAHAEPVSAKASEPGLTPRPWLAAAAVALGVAAVLSNLLIRRGGPALFQRTSR